MPLRKPTHAILTIPIDARVSNFVQVCCATVCLCQLYNFPLLAFPSLKRTSLKSFSGAPSVSVNSPLSSFHRKRARNANIPGVVSPMGTGHTYMCVYDERRTDDCGVTLGKIPISSRRREKEINERSNFGMHPMSIRS